MRVIGNDDVDAIAEGGVLQVARGDLVTPLARDRAKERGVSIVFPSSSGEIAPQPPPQSRPPLAARRPGNGAAPSPAPSPSAVRGFLLPQQLSQHVVQDPAVAVVELLLGRVDAHPHVEALAVGLHGQRVRNLLAAGDAFDRELLLTAEPKRLGILTF